jgi:pyruvate kinase
MSAKIESPASSIKTSRFSLGGIPLIVPVLLAAVVVTASAFGAIPDNMIGGLVVIAAGSPPGVPGSTNMVKVHRVGDLADAGGDLPREKVGPWPDDHKP